MFAELALEANAFSNSPAEDTCRACGACCIGEVSMPLSRKEASMLRAAGTKLEQDTYHGGREETYSRSGACSFLEVASDGLYSCMLYGLPERPRTCGVTESEGSECGDFRDDTADFLLPDANPPDLVAILENDQLLDSEFGMLGR